MLAVTKPSKNASVWMNRVDEDESAATVFFDEEQRKSLVSACRARYASSRKSRFPYGEAYIFDMYTGLRLGELLALTWSDIDFEKRVIRVHSSMSLVKDRDRKSKTYGRMVLRIFPYTKTDQPRTVPLGTMALAAANELLAVRMASSPYVVHGKSGGLVWPTNFLRGLISSFDLAGIDLPHGTNVHALRHTFASMCFKVGMPVRVISDLLGHSSVQITMDTYISSKISI